MTPKNLPLFAPTRRLSSCLFALLTYGVAQAGEGALDQRPKQIHPSYLQQQQLPQQQRQQHADQLQLTPAVSTTAKLLERITGGANNHRRRKHSSRHQPAGGGGGGGEGSTAPDAIEVWGADLAESTNGRSSQQQHLDGVYVREWDVNGAPHFKRRSKRGSRSSPVHLFFTGSEWMLHLDVEANLDINHCLAYSEVAEVNPLRTTRKWAVRVGQAWVRRPHMRLAETSPDAEPRVPAWKAKEESRASAGGNRYGGSSDNGLASAEAQKAVDDAALSRRLLPLYAVFVLDAVGLGVALPVLPFFVMGLKATALQLAIVVSSNYIAQTFGKGRRRGYP
ncbi:unnamed protein product [Ectocarpus sp. 12 AP-2014]